MRSSPALTINRFYDYACKQLYLCVIEDIWALVAARAEVNFNISTLEVQK